jgi:hypothetical protein
MKHFRWTAEEIIGWMRIARPGSVIGPQQQFLKYVQNRMWREGDLYRQRNQQLSLPSVQGIKGEQSGTGSGSSNGVSSHAGTLSGGTSVSERFNPSRPISSSAMSPTTSQGIAMHDGNSPVSGHSPGSNVPSTPLLNPSQQAPLNSRMGLMSLGSNSRTAYASPTGTGSGKLNASTGSGKTPTSPSYFDARPSSSPRSSVALASYFRASTATTATSPSTGRSVANATQVSTDMSVEVKEEAEGRSQGDLLRQRRAQHLAGQAAVQLPTSPGGTSDGRGTTPTSGKMRSGRAFNFLSSWK